MARVESFIYSCISASVSCVCLCVMSQRSDSRQRTGDRRNQYVRRFSSMSVSQARRIHQTEPVFFVTNSDVIYTHDRQSTFKILAWPSHINTHVILRNSILPNSSRRNNSNTTNEPSTNTNETTTTTAKNNDEDWLKTG